MKNYILPIFILLCTTALHAQKKEKIKGNRTVVSQTVDIVPFTGLDVQEDLDIVLVNGGTPGIEITADENLHDVLMFKVDDSILSISTTKRIRSKKKLEIYITVDSGFSKLNVGTDTHISSVTTIKVPQLEINTVENAKLDLKIESDTLRINSFGKSKGNYHLRAKSLILDVNESSDLIANVYAETLTSHMEYGDIKLSGKVDSLAVKAKEKATFVAVELTTKNASVEASEQGKVVLNATKSVTIDATGKSEIHLYNSPQTITITRFDNEAILRKRDINKKGFLKNIF